MTAAARLRSYFALYKRRLLLGALCVVASSFFSLLKPLIIGDAVNTLGRGFTHATLVRFGALLVGAAILEGIFLYLQRWIIIGVSRLMEFDMRNDFYQHLQKLPVDFYQEQRTGDLMSRATNDLASVRMLIGPAVMHSASSLLVVLGAFLMMVRIDAVMGLVALLAVPVVAGLVKTFGQKIHDRSTRVQEYFGEISARVQENIAGVRVVRAFTRESHEVDTFKRMNHEYVDRNRSLIRLTATFYPALHSLIGVMFVILFYFGTRKILAGKMTLGDFVAFQFYLGRMVWPLIAFGWVINLFQRGMASMKRLHTIWSAPTIVPSTGETTAGDAPPRGDLEIRNLTFSYGPRDVLRDVQLTVRHGETVGIVGRTGSGKSTLLALVTRVFEPPPGTIFIDGRPIETIPLRELRDWVGMVPQETFLFSESIAENIRFGRATATDDEVQTAANQAGLDTDVAGFPQGIGTMIGERGITLSGGQKQRTAIARALVREPLILILDDSLSAVDTHTEEKILQALRSVRQGRTALIVSHRVSSVKDADQIIVLDDGRIVERGTHEALLEKGGYYADLYRRQTIEAELEEIA
ncbi:MAG TPA: ABC transporter ATP-binding protein [Thermoanaerobaculia bacterium]|nr:ABC transporter ATP-binding protein [Thermoanaerobaculia bacterium]